MKNDDGGEPPPLPPPSEELYVALGKLVFNFGQLEESLHLALFAALDESDEARIVLTGLSFRQLLDRFGAVHARFVSESSGERGVTNLCKMLATLNEERNREIHATWGFWAESGRPVRTRQRIQPNAGVAFSMESVSSKTLLELAERMLSASNLIWQVQLDFSRQRQRERQNRELSGEF